MSHLPSEIKEAGLFVDRLVFALSLIPVIDQNLENGQETFFIHVFVVLVILVFASYQFKRIVFRWTRTSPALLNLLWYKYLLKLATFLQFFFTFSLIRVFSRRMDNFLGNQTILSLQFIRPTIIAAAVIWIFVALEYEIYQSELSKQPERTAAQEVEEASHLRRLGDDVMEEQFA